MMMDVDDFAESFAMEIVCNGEKVILEVDTYTGAEEEVKFHGLDVEAEAASAELGFEPSWCFVLHQRLTRYGLDLERSLDGAMEKYGNEGDARAMEIILQIFEWLGLSTYRRGSVLYAFQTAAEDGYVDVVELLMNEGVDPLEDDAFAIEAACFNRQEEVIEFFRQNLDRHDWPECLTRA
jgi:hypothetical protein